LSVVELVRAGTERTEGQEEGEPIVQMIDATPVLRLRDRLLPLVNLNDLLHLGAGPAARTDARRHIVVAQVGASLLGIAVDRVFDTEEIVVKPVAPILRHITMFSGNTILGDGSVIMILDPNGIARANGIAGSESRVSETAARATVAQSEQRTAMLLFRAGGTSPKAVPLGLVARLEDIERDRIEISAGQPVVQYRGRLMPLVPLSGTLDTEKERQAVLVFNDIDRGLGRDRCMGLVVDEILDVVEDRLRIELSGDRPGLLGTAVVAGRATDVIDTAYWLTQAADDWFRSGQKSGGVRIARVLVVEDSDFFRNLLVPALAAEGYEVTACETATRALRLRDAGVSFDAVVSDIEMPEMDGLEFVRTLRAGGAWAELPVLALSGRVSSAEMAAGRSAGFTDYVGKFDRAALLASLRQCLGEAAHAA
jgi:two-component system chemotaxis sensor kinase CheA